MADAANYLRVSEDRITQSYKLRTRTVEAKTFTVTNTTNNYRLSVDFSVSLEGVSISPSRISLEPEENKVISVSFDSGILETYPSGVIVDNIQALVSGQLLTVVQEPLREEASGVPPAAPPAAPPVDQPSPPHLDAPPPEDEVVISVTPLSQLIESINQPVQYVARLFVNGEFVQGAEFNWGLSSDDNFSITDAGIVTAKRSGEYSAAVSAAVSRPTEYFGQNGTALVKSKIGQNIGNIKFVVRGLVDELSPVLSLSGPVNRTLTQFIRPQDSTRTKDVIGVPVGDYVTVPPTLTTVNGIVYRPSTIGIIKVESGKTTLVEITYEAQFIPQDLYQIDIVSVGRISAGSVTGTNVLRTQTRIEVGDRVFVGFFIKKNGVNTNVGPVPVSLTGTAEGSLIAEQGDTSVTIPVIGFYGETFTAKDPGVQTITISHQGVVRTLDIEFFDKQPSMITIYCTDVDFERFNDPANCQEYRVFAGESCTTLSTRLIECDPEGGSGGAHLDTLPPPHFDSTPPTHFDSVPESPTPPRPREDDPRDDIDDNDNDDDDLLDDTGDDSSSATTL